MHADLHEGLTENAQCDCGENLSVTRSKVYIVYVPPHGEFRFENFWPPLGAFLSGHIAPVGNAQYVQHRTALRQWLEFRGCQIIFVATLKAQRVVLQLRSSGKRKLLLKCTVRNHMNEFKSGRTGLLCYFCGHELFKVLLCFPAQRQLSPIFFVMPNFTKAYCTAAC